MVRRSIRRHFISISAAVFIFSTVAPVFAQRPGGGGAPGAGPGSAGSVGRSSIPNAPTTGNTPFPGSIPTNPGNNPTYPGARRPIYLSGKVIFEDGTPANPNINIERVCGGSIHLEGHTDSKGNFSVQLGQNPMGEQEAIDSSPDALYPGMSPDQQRSTTQPWNRNTAGPNGLLWNCDLRASYPGYRSDLLTLASRHELDNPDIGTIVLHRLRNVQGTTISVTTALAPKHAQKEYEKGLQAAKKGEFDEAEKHLARATERYPKYAIAWFALGEVEQVKGDAGAARKSFESAIAADSRYVSPYDRLALLTAKQGKWDETASYSKQAISLNPVEFPSDFWYNAIANYNLKKRDEAEKSARELLKVDTGHKYPQAENLLAQISLEKGNYAGAATHLRAYLALVPNAKNAAQLKEALLKLDQARAANNPAPKQ